MKIDKLIRLRWEIKCNGRINIAESFEEAAEKVKEATLAY